METVQSETSTIVFSQSGDFTPEHVYYGQQAPGSTECWLVALLLALSPLIVAAVVLRRRRRTA